ncbi:MAG: hypothetical protein JST31_03700 [Actinobacteria bacterium]|nr:hypothetical protein [Actinomycetota bacterium]
MDTKQRDDERVVAEFLQPLSELQPASRPAAGRARRPVRRTVRRTTVVAFVAICLGTGGALAATGVFGPLHDVTLQPPANPISCSGLIGRPAGAAIRFFSAHGYSVSWRYQTFGTTVVEPSHPGEPTGVVGGRSTEVERPPHGTVLFDAEIVGGADSKRVIAFAVDRDDPNAPQVQPPRGC